MNSWTNQYHYKIIEKTSQASHHHTVIYARMIFSHILMDHIIGKQQQQLNPFRKSTNNEDELKLLLISFFSTSRESIRKY